MLQIHLQCFIFDKMGLDNLQKENDCKLKTKLRYQYASNIYV